MKLTNQIGERIRAIRKSRGLSQEELAERASIHYTYIGQVERGEKNFSIDTLENVIISLDTNFEELFRNLPVNLKNVEDTNLELLINRIKEKNPKDRKTILKVFNELLDWKGY